MNRIFFFTLMSTLSITSCVFKADEVKIKGFDISKARGGKTETPVSISVDDVVLENDQIKVTGSALDSVSEIKLNGNLLSIISQSTSELILTSSSALNLALNTAMDLVFTNAYGQSVVSVQFNLVDGVVTAAKLADDSVTNAKIVDGAVTADKLSDMSAGIGQVLKFNGSTWVPGDLSSLTYAGNWNASTNSPDLSGGGNLGEFYIVNNAGAFNLAGGAGTNSWAVGDWAVWNNVVGQWEKIDNATNVQSFNGRSGAVTPALNDYTWAQVDKSTSSLGDIADVDLTGATDGKVLKYQSGTWVIADDLSSGGAGSVSSSEIADGTIVNADINASAAIDQSKISGLPALATSVATNTSDIATHASSISTNTSNITSNDTDIATNATNIATNTSTISSLSTTVGTKAASAITLDAGAGLSGGGDLSANRSFAVNVDDATIEIATDSLQVKNIPDTKLTTACSDGEVLSASSGTFVCAASSTIGNWTLSTTDLFYTAGNVGVGTSSLNGKLNIRTSTSLNGAADYNGQNFALVIGRDDGNNIGDEGQGVVFTQQYTDDGSDASQVRVGAIVGYKDQPTGSFGGGLKFKVQPAGATAMTDALVINKLGNVGIGVNPPTEKLDVAGTIKATAFEGDGTSIMNVNAASANTVTASAGAAATPSISFSGDSDTGIFSETSNVLSFTFGGSNTFDVSGSGISSETTGGAVVNTNNGSTATPTFSFKGDEDTGWYRSAADTLAAATAGVERVSINPSGQTYFAGNVVVGSPSAPSGLTITNEHQSGFYGYMGTQFKGGANSTIGAVGLNISPSQSSDNFTGDSYSYLSLGSRSSTLSSTGHTANTYLVSRPGDLNTTYGSSDFMIYQRNDTTDWTFDNDPSNLSSTWLTEPTLTVKAEGSLVVGGSDNSIAFNASTLDSRITATSTATGPQILGNFYKISDDANPGFFGFARARGTPSALTPVLAEDFISALYFVGHDGTDYNMAAKIAARVDGTVTDSNVPGRLEFRTVEEGDGNSESIRMVIKNDGKVGIGTSSPDERLEVAGTVKATSFVGKGALLASYQAVSQTSLSTTSTSWSTVTDMNIDFTTTSNTTIQISHFAMYRTNDQATGNVRLIVDGTAVTGGYANQAPASGVLHENISFNWLQNISAGSHNVKVEWRDESGLGTFYTGFANERMLNRTLQVMVFGN